MLLVGLVKIVKVNVSQAPMDLTVFKLVEIAGSMKIAMWYVLAKLKGAHKLNLITILL